MSTDDQRWERHAKKAEAELREMRAAFDGATPKELRRLRDLEARLAVVDVVFEGPPGPEGPRFVEVEIGGTSISIGEWIERPDGRWALRITAEMRGK